MTYKLTITRKSDQQQIRQFEHEQLHVLLEIKSRWMTRYPSRYTYTIVSDHMIEVTC